MVLLGVDVDQPFHGVRRRLPRPRRMNADQLREHLRGGDRPPTHHKKLVNSPRKIPDWEKSGFKNRSYHSLSPVCGDHSSIIGIWVRVGSVSLARGEEAKTEISSRTDEKGEEDLKGNHSPHSTAIPWN